MKRSVKSGLAALLVLCCSQSVGQTVLIEKGVSEKLAIYREMHITNVHYQLYFSIPANKKEVINVHETISFHLQQNSLPLQIDFKENGDHLLKIAVNEKNIPIIFHDEHIVIDTRYLKQGANKVQIDFIAGELSLNRNNDYLY